MRQLLTDYWPLRNEQEQYVVRGRVKGTHDYYFDTLEGAKDFYNRVGKSHDEEGEWETGGYHRPEFIGKA